MVMYACLGPPGDSEQQSELCAVIVKAGRSYTNIQCMIESSFLF